MANGNIFNKMIKKTKTDLITGECVIIHNKVINTDTQVITIKIIIKNRSRTELENLTSFFTCLIST